jgi:hypothetical protein
MPRFALVEACKGFAVYDDVVSSIVHDVTRLE